MVANKENIAVVIPAYGVKAHILDVISKIGSEVSNIFVIDDKCPEETGAYVLSRCDDKRVSVIFNKCNLGVGGATIAGYHAAIQAGVDIIVKIDGDGQMDPRLIPSFVLPITQGHADYTKGNRFFNIEKIYKMPKARLFGNTILSFMNKLSSGYWDIFDPTNGYTAIHTMVAKQLPFEKISNRYFFESDILFRLNTLRAVVLDIPMDTHYGDEVSHLKIHKIIGEFLIKHIRNFTKRVFYNYYLRDMSLASIELPLGLILFTFGSVFGVFHWIYSYQQGVATPPGTVMLASLTVLMGFQLILAFLNYDIANVPKRAFHLASIISK